jgi:hypothetical protein
MERLLLALSSTTEPRAATYVAGPITNGPLFLEWYAQRGRHLSVGTPEYRDARREAVVHPNVERGLAVARNLRQEGVATVIEPFSLDVPEWSQDDYRWFWGQVIEHLVARIHLLEGWSMSNGSAFECLTGLRAGLEVVHEGHPLTPERAQALVGEALPGLDSAGADTGFLERVQAELASLIRP